MTENKEDVDYLKRMGVEDEGDIAAKIVYWITSNEEDSYYAIKYGRRMIRALVEKTCRERGCIW